MSTKINNSFWKCKIFSSFYEGIKSASIYGLLRCMAICAISFLTSSIFQSLRLRLEEGQAQVFAAGLAVELRLFADGGRSAAAFAPDLEEVGGAEVEGVLPVFPGEGVDRLVELPDLLRLQGIFEEGVLDPRILDEVHQDNAGRPVGLVAPVHPVEQAAEQLGELQREGGGAVEFRLPPLRVEVLLLQEGGDPPGGEAVAPRLDAGRLQVPEQVGEEVIPVGCRRGEGLRLADRGVAALLPGRTG